MPFGSHHHRARQDGQCSVHPGLQDSRRDPREALHEGMTVDEVLGAYAYLDAEDINRRSHGQPRRVSAS